jgi:hypothetical protein
MQQPACFPELDVLYKTPFLLKGLNTSSYLTYQLQLNTTVSLLNVESLESLIILAFLNWVFRLKEQQVYRFAGQSNI